METYQMPSGQQGVGLSKDDFLRAPQDVKDSVLYDNLVLIRNSLTAIAECEGSRDKRAMARAAGYGILGGFLAVIAVTGVMWAIEMLRGLHPTIGG